MSTSVTAGPAHAGLRLPKALGLAGLFAVGVAFVIKYVFHYYLNYNPAGFGPHWSTRGMLLAHITSGTVALLIGPFQFSQRLRQLNLRLHRTLGRTYLIAVLCGSLAAIGLAITTTFGPLWEFSLICMALAWSTCGGMAYYAVRLRQIAVHQQWMVRTYTVTFGFVTFRLLDNMGPTSRIGSAGTRAVAYVWACWVIPLVAAEVIMQLRQLRRIRRPAT